MIYNILFYLFVMSFLYHNITGNIEMIDQSFKGLVICGFLNIFHLFDSLNRR
jgi:hypothetical protein